jgi:hypothetical protein
MEFVLDFAAEADVDQQIDDVCSESGSLGPS